jgi:hypothetical protein
VADTLEVTVLFDFNEAPVFVVPGDSQNAINLRWDASRAEREKPVSLPQNALKMRSYCKLCGGPHVTGTDCTTTKLSNLLSVKMFHALRDAAGMMERTEEMCRLDGWNDRHALYLEDLRLAAGRARAVLLEAQS